MDMLTVYQDECDPEMIEAIVKAARTGMSRAVIPDVTTSSEVLSAVFTLLDRTLRSVRSLQTPEERFENAAEINKVLKELLTDHGHVPN